MERYSEAKNLSALKKTITTSIFGIGLLLTSQALSKDGLVINLATAGKLKIKGDSETGLVISYSHEGSSIFTPITVSNAVNGITNLPKETEDFVKSITDKLP